MTTQVVLVHGLLNARSWLWPLALRLRGQGFKVALFGYSSLLEGPLHALPRLHTCLQDTGATAVVGHSLGGLLALEALRQSPELPVARVVCLGSPLRGSETARRVAAKRWVRPLLGRSATLLQGGLPAWEGAAAVGVVAGVAPRGMGCLFAKFEGHSDGTVGLEETRLPGLADHCCVPCSHTGLVLSPQAAAQAAHFLRHGQFERTTGLAAV